jgi:hypothetical protein
MIRRLVLASVIVSLAFPFASVAPTSAAVDTWRVLHVGLESFPASDDTDGDGVVNTWGGSQGQTTCTPVGRKGKKEKCTTTPGTVAGSPLYQAWQTDVACFEPTVEAWSDYQIDIYQESVFIQTNQAIENSPYSFMWSGLAAQYGFENYDVVMVWTGYTQATGWDGGTRHRLFLRRLVRPGGRLPGSGEQRAMARLRPGARVRSHRHRPLQQRRLSRLWHLRVPLPSERTGVGAPPPHPDQHRHADRLL